MPEISHNKVLVVGGKEVVIRELTVAGVRNLMASNEDSSLFDDTFFEDVRIADLRAFTSLTSDDIEALHPSTIRLIINACKELNPDFFTWMARMEVSQKPV